MSFFKDFKEDFTQAMNELMPDGNEMYDEDEIMEEESVEEPEEKTAIKSVPVREKAPAREKAVKEKKPARVKKEQVEELKEETENRKVRMTRPPKEIPLKTKVMAEEPEEEAFDIAPEDMLEQIDDLLDRELYSDDAEPAALLNDDTEVNTMDMSVEELLSQLSEKKVTTKEELSIDDLLGQLDSAAPVYHNEDIVPELSEEEDSDIVRQEENSVIMEEESEQSSYTGQADMGLEELLDSIAAKSNVNFSESKALYDTLQNEAVNEEEIEEPELRTEEITGMTEPEETLMESEEEEVILDEILAEAKQQTAVPIQEPESIVPEALEPEELAEASEKMEEPEEPEYIMEETEEPEEPEDTVADTEEPEDAVEEMEEMVEPEDVTEEIEEEPEDVTEEIEEAVEIKAVQTEHENADIKPDIEEMKADEKIEKALEENKMSEEKDVISISPVEEKADAVKEESVFNAEDADTETTYITKGSKLTGDLETDGSIDIIGTIEGSVSCKGKVVVGGKVVGNIIAGELYANNARIEGDIKSYGSVKVGVGSMIIGGIEGESAVIAGAVNGDIDVKGPVIVDSTAVIMGNIKSRSVQINNGAVIEGFCSQSYSDIDVKSFFA